MHSVQVIYFFCKKGEKLPRSPQKSSTNGGNADEETTNDKGQNIINA